MKTFQAAAMKWRKHFGLQLAVDITSALPWRSFDTVIARVSNMADVAAVTNAIAGHEARLRSVGRFWILSVPSKPDLTGRIDRSILGVLGNDPTWVSARLFAVEFKCWGVIRRGSVHLFTRRRLAAELTEDPESPLGQPFWVHPSSNTDVKAVWQWLARRVVQFGLSQGQTLLEIRAADGVLAAEAIDLGRRAMINPADARARNLIDKDTNLTPRLDGF